MQLHVYAYMKLSYELILFMVQFRHPIRCCAVHLEAATFTVQIIISPYSYLGNSAEETFAKFLRYRTDVDTNIVW